MRKLIIYYNFIIVSLFVVAGFIGATSYVQLAISILFFPLAVYFALLVIPKRSKSLHLPKIQVLPKDSLPQIVEEAELVAQPIKSPADVDTDRRSFLKLIGSAGVSVFFFALFTRKAEAAFFGSVPGPGTVSVKDTAGNKIDPAEKHPTDGYRISELDDGVVYIYGGYINKDGAWFISREEISTGSYRYARGATSFSTNWTNRASLSYDYFNNVF